MAGTLTQADCVACHTAQAAEWQGSLHQESGIDKTYHAFRKMKDSDLECLACHISEPVFSVAIGETPAPRTSDLRGGVTCLTCHLVGDRVAGSQTREDVPCRPIATPVLAKAEHCAGCHKAYGKINTLHEYDEWKLRHPDHANHQCQDCHMDIVTRPPAKGLPAKPGRHHGFAVQNNEAILRDALDLEVTRSVTRGWELTLTNKGSGHRYPTGYVMKSIAVMLHTPEGHELFKYSLQKASPWGGTSTQLADKETRRITLPDLSGHEKVMLSARYKYTLNIRDDDVSPFIEIPIIPADIPLNVETR